MISATGLMDFRCLRLEEDALLELNQDDAFISAALATRIGFYSAFEHGVGIQASLVATPTWTRTGLALIWAE